MEYFTRLCRTYIFQCGHFTYSGSLRLVMDCVIKGLGLLVWIVFWMYIQGSCIHVYVSGFSCIMMYHAQKKVQIYAMELVNKKPSKLTWLVYEQGL